MKQSLFIAAAMIIVVLPVQLNSEEEIVPLGTVADAYIDFGFRVYDEISKDNDRSNIFISPLSLALATSILYNGAAGETMEEFKNTLGLNNFSLSEFNEANRELLDEYSSYNAKSDNLDLEIHNSLWMREDWEFKEEFKDDIIGCYDAEAFIGLDKGKMLEWITKRSRGKIDNIDFELSPLSVAVVINSIYLKDSWQEMFNKSNTYKTDFFRYDNTKKSINMMKNGSNYAYYEDYTIQAVEMRLTGEAFSTIIILPREGMCLDEVKIDAVMLDRIDKSSHILPGQIHLPRFKVVFESQFREALQNMGMISAFDSLRANFERMAYFEACENVWIDDLIQKTYLDVDEDGIEAIAITSGTALKTDIRKADQFKMVVDRPFFIIIRDNRYGLILFMGAIFDPVMIN